MASLNTNRAIPPITLPEGLQTVPNAAADLTTTDTVIFQATFRSKTGVPATVTVKDKQSSPKTLYEATTVPGNGALSEVWPEGVLMKGGVNWVASAANAVDAEIFGFRRQ